MTRQTVPTAKHGQQRPETLGRRVRRMNSDDVERSRVLMVRTVRLLETARRVLEYKPSKLIFVVVDINSRC